MKRLSNKKRKLNYIREKNHYRLGGFGASYFKMTKEMFEDSNFSDRFIKTEIENNLLKLKSIFKLDFKIDRFETGLDGNDFIHDLITIKYYYKKH